MIIDIDRANENIISGGGRGSGKTTAMILQALALVDFDVPEITIVGIDQRSSDWMSRMLMDRAKDMGFEIFCSIGYSVWVNKTHFNFISFEQLKQIHKKASEGSLGKKPKIIPLFIDHYVDEIILDSYKYNSYKDSILCDWNKP